MISDKVNPIFSSQIGIYFEWRHFLDVKPDFRIFSISHCFKKHLFLVEQLNLFSSVITPFSQPKNKNYSYAYKGAVTTGKDF